jgi:hypothetical protein
MTSPQVVALVLRLLMTVYGYSLVMATGQVISCEIRNAGACADQWTQAFTISAGAASTLWAYITDSPVQLQSSRKTSNASTSSDSRRQRPSEPGA